MVNNNKLNRLNAVMLRYIILFSVAFIILAVFEHIAYAESRVRIIEGDEWSYFQGKEMLPQKWNHFGFDDTTWQRGRSPFGYGNYKLETLFPDMQGNYLNLLVRREFTVNPSEIRQINLFVLCDGPFIAYINGIEVVRSKTRLTMPIDISGFAHELLLDNNVLAIECSNDDINSNSFQLIPLLDILVK